MRTKLRKNIFFLFVFLLNTSLLMLELDYLLRRERYAKAFGESSAISEETAESMLNILTLRDLIGQGILIITIAVFILFIYKSNKNRKYFFGFSIINTGFVLIILGLSSQFSFHALEALTAMTLPILLNILLGLDYLKKKINFPQIKLIKNIRQLD